jgi:hypothetical protein
MSISFFGGIAGAGKKWWGFSSVAKYDFCECDGNDQAQMMANFAYSPINMN